MNQQSLNSFGNNSNNSNQFQNSTITPYQGRKRCFGEFKCERCGKEWKSSNSKANETQTCSLCNSQVFPFKQVSHKLHIYIYFFS